VLTVKEPYQLLLVRELHDDGVRLVRQDTRFSRLRGVITEDMAVELMLNTIIHDGGSTADPDKLIKWTSVWQAATEIAKANGMPTGLPNGNRLKRLHEVRNLAHHNGTVPDTSEATRYLDAVTGLLKAAFKGIYDREYDYFTLSDAIAHPGLRELLVDATTALDDGRLAIAAIAVVGTHNLISGSLSALLFGQGSIESRYQVNDRLRGSLMPERERQAFVDVFERLGKQVSASMQAVHAQVASTSLGIPMSDARRFAMITRGIWVAFAFSGEAHASLQRPAPALNDLRWCLDYLFRYCIRMQDVFPEVLEAIEVRQRWSDQKLWKAEYAKRPGDTDGTPAPPAPGATGAPSPPDTEPR
jgi:hypothetical protein